MSKKARFSGGGETIEYKMCAKSFSTTFVWNIFILRRTEQDMIKNLYWSTYKVRVIPARFWWNVYILDRFSKNTQM